ncbi:MAG: AAA family ATPase [Candidatus Sericytochromatia bacterium]|nr:AAA family ATPase [Candidatus Sericytochromatia bacterium]
MISDIDFTNIKDSENFKYTVELDFFKKNTQMQFKPGLNIIYAPNGTGKSTLLKIMAQFTASEQGGVSTITNSWVQDVSGYRDSKLKGLAVKHDGQAVMYTNPRQAVGLFGGMAAFDNDFLSEGVAETQLKQSTGLTTLYRMQRILGILTGKVQAPSKIAIKGGSLNEITKELLKASIPEGQKTILLDEPESGLAVHVQANLWKMIEQAAIKHDLQIIVASHSPFALACKANYIELQPGYLDTSRSYIKQISQNIELMEAMKKIEAKIEKTPKTVNIEPIASPVKVRKKTY